MHQKATLTNGPLAIAVSKEAKGTTLRTSKSTSEKRTSLQHNRILAWLGMSQGQGHPVVNSHKGAVHPMQETPGSQGKLGAHLLLH